MQHRPRLTPFGRLLLVQHVTQLDWTSITAAEAMGVSMASAIRGSVLRPIAIQGPVLRTMVAISQVVRAPVPALALGVKPAATIASSTRNSISPVGETLVRTL